MQVARRSTRFIVGIAAMMAEFSLGQAMVKTVPLTIEQLIDIKHPSNPVWRRTVNTLRSFGTVPAFRIST